MVTRHVSWHLCDLACAVMNLALFLPVVVASRPSQADPASFR